SAPRCRRNRHRPPGWPVPGRTAGPGSAARRHPLCSLPWPCIAPFRGGTASVPAGPSGHRERARSGTMGAFLQSPRESMSSAFGTETVLDVRHWTDDYFSFATTRDPGLRFTSGQFVMLGLQVAQPDGTRKPLLRAYSIASASWEERLEFFSIKVPDGALTSRLQHIRPGDQVLVGRKPTGTLLVHDLHPGRNLYLLGTGPGFAPWRSTIKDPETWERYERVVLCHGVRRAADLCYRDEITQVLPEHEFLGELVRGRLHYYPAVTREDFVHEGRRHR